MKRYISYMTCALAVIVAAGCIKVEIQHYSASTVAKLQLKNTDLVETRADGKKGLNENYIATIQCFFSVDGTSVDYATGIINIGKHDAGNGVEHPLDIPSEVLGDLFPNGATTCKLYVLANAPKVGNVSTIADIKETAITLEAYGTSGPAAQTSFVMDTKELASVTKNDNTLAGTVNLTRAAAKIEVDLKVNKQIVIGEGNEAVIWTPDLNNVRITYNQSVTKSTVNAEPDNASVRDSYAQTAQPFTFTTTDALSYSTGVQKMPFYSYPSQWPNNKAEEAANILLEIPWKKATETEYKTYRYQIPVNFDDMKLLRNHIYKLSINVGILGALDGEVEIKPSYIVVDWKSHTINTELSRPQYLYVFQNKVIMNNVTSYSVDYKSSDDITAYIIGFKCTYHYDSNPADDTMGTTTQVSEEWEVSEKIASLNDVVPQMDGSNYKFSVSWNKDQVTLNHDLDNEMSDKKYHHFPYEVTVRVTNTATGYYEDIIFIQYPALYVVPNEMTTSTVFINGHTSGNSGHWYYVRNAPSKTKSLLTVSISSFDTDTERYKICDPREPSNNDDFVFRDGNNTNSPVVATAEDESGDKTLTGYRATISGDAAEDLVAPEFMFSSSYISNGSNSFKSYTADATGKYRCAAYQEFGYPAGRWRLPTPAELEVMGKLCAEGKVETLFYNNATYMSSNGPYLFNGTNGTFTKSNATTSNTIRCVYDTWYWKDKCAIDKFIWGAEGDIANGAKSDFLVSVE